MIYILLLIRMVVQQLQKGSVQRNLQSQRAPS